MKRAEKQGRVEFWVWKHVWCWREHAEGEGTQGPTTEALKGGDRATGKEGTSFIIMKGRKRRGSEWGEGVILVT